MPKIRKASIVTIAEPESQDKKESAVKVIGSMLRTAGLRFNVPLSNDKVIVTEYESATVSGKRRENAYMIAEIPIVHDDLNPGYKWTISIYGKRSEQKLKGFIELASKRFSQTPILHAKSEKRRKIEALSTEQQ
ncbi:MAG: hypothetical protein KGH61_05205 [Candidatus Micrarchaeota archaeon]|nr:hypothetical protein [Candidatus Micrarchaeota archaeon]MDE1848312.1 hypothetical protein [Candidatus Micrarchaeota archaeon]